MRPWGGTGRSQHMAMASGQGWGGVPKAGPPHVMAGVMPVLARIVALLFTLVMNLARAARPFAAARRLLACEAMRLLPELTGVPRSVTGALALTAVPLAVIRLAAWQARALSLALMTVFVALGVLGGGVHNT